LFCSAFSFSFLIFFSFSSRLWLLPSMPLKRFPWPEWRASFYSLNSWHESMLEILTSHECGNASPAMNATLSGAKRNEDLFRWRLLTRSATASLIQIKLMKVNDNTKNMMNKEFQYSKES
jgi:hypothetical protein